MAGYLDSLGEQRYRFSYLEDYFGSPVSLTMPVQEKTYEFDKFPAFFEGLLPEGVMLEALLRKYKLDKQDYFAQLLCVGNDVVGAVTIEPIV
jgi:serine/threonine-protein kinase HipA